MTISIIAIKKFLLNNYQFDNVHPIAASFKTKIKNEINTNGDTNQLREKIYNKCLAHFAQIGHSYLTGEALTTAEKQAISRHFVQYLVLENEI